MNIVTQRQAIANQAALELYPLAAYLDAHDTGRAPVNPNAYIAVAQRIRILLSPHLDNPHVRRICRKSRSLCEMLENIQLEQEPGLVREMECVLDEAKLTAYWLQ